MIYYSNFDPGGPTDPYFSQVVLLAGFEGGAYTDDSNYHRTLTDTGLTSTTAQPKFGSYSLSCGGGSQRLGAADAAELTLGTSAFTFEAWAYKNVGSPNGYIFCQQDLPGTASGAAWALAWLSNGKLEAKAISGNAIYTQFSTTGTVSTDAWHHIVYERNAAGKFRIYADGAMVASATPGTAAIDNSADDLSIANAGSGIGFEGYIDEVRLTIGTARYDSDSGYTTPTAAFPRS